VDVWVFVNGEFEESANDIQEYAERGSFCLPDFEKAVCEPKSPDILRIQQRIAGATDCATY
jgi:hypothetical protein